MLVGCVLCCVVMTCFRLVVALLAACLCRTALAVAAVLLVVAVRDCLLLASVDHVVPALREVAEATDHECHLNWAHVEQVACILQPRQSQHK